MEPNASPRKPLPRRLDPRVAPRRLGGQRLAVLTRLVAAVLSAALLAGSGWGWYLARVAEASVGRTDALPGEGNTDARGGDHAGRALNLLLVGRDSRAGLTPEQQVEYSTGDPEGLLNTDTMMLAHVPADGSAAAFVSLPRDLYVSIPGYGEHKLNAAFAFGYTDATGSAAEREAAGAQLLIRTVSALTGLRIDHYAEVDLLGFVTISDIVGGVEVNLCNDVDDPKSGAHFSAGPQTISGADALAFVRQRDGLPRTDLDRQVRQQVFLAGLLRNMLSSDVLLDLGRQRRLIEQIGSSLTVDEDLDLFELATQMQSVKPADITFQTIPGLTDVREDVGLVLLPPSPPVLHDFFASLGGTPAPPEESSAEPVDPGDVVVDVFNGSGVSGAAAAAAEALAGAGFAAGNGGNADAAADLTTVRHTPGDEARAAAVLAQVPGAAVTADDSLPEGTVHLVLGADFNGVGQAVTAPPVEEPGGYDTRERTAEDTSCIA